MANGLHLHSALIATMLKKVKPRVVAEIDVDMGKVKNKMAD